MTGWPLLSLVTFLPLLGALFIFLAGTDREHADRNAKYIALYTTLINFALALFLWSQFDASNPGFQFKEEIAWLGGGLSFKLGEIGRAHV